MTPLPPPRVRTGTWRERLQVVGRSALLGLTLALASVIGFPAAAEAVTEPETPAVVFLFADINGSGGNVSAAIMSRSVRARFRFETVSSTDGTGAGRLTARLQQRVGAGGRWTDTGQTVSTSSTTFDVRIRPYSLDPRTPDVTVHYRLVASAGRAPGADAVSPSVRFDYQNWHRYSGLKRALYADMSAFCPDMAIRTGDREQERAKWAGVTPRGLYETSIVRRVALYKRVDQRAVMLHECAHHLQWQNYGASIDGWTQMEQEAAQVFGTNHDKPIEHMADCAAQAANPGGYLGYGGRCTAVQLSAAEATLGIGPAAARPPSLERFTPGPGLMLLGIGLAAVCIGLLAFLAALAIVRTVASTRRPSRAALADVRRRVAAMAADRPTVEPTVPEPPSP